jgi:hypothetical protein
MSNYTKATNFATKDTLPTGDANKIVKGTEIDNEFTAIASAVTSKADLASPTFTGTPAAPTATAGTNTTQIATTAFVTAVTSTLGTMSTQNANAVAITGGSVTGITDLAVSDGGTGVSTIAANAVVLGNGTSAIQTVAPSTAGNILTSNGTTWTSAAALIEQQQFSFALRETAVNSSGTPLVYSGTPGTLTFTAPTGVTRVKLTVIGGGGGGGGGGAGVNFGGQGGYGGYAHGIYTVVPGTAYTVTVGVGGTGGNGTSGTSGGTSSFASLVSATGGGGGGYNNNTAGANGTSTTGNIRNGVVNNIKSPYFYGVETTPNVFDGGTVSPRIFTASLTFGAGVTGSGGDNNFVNQNGGGGVSGLVLIEYVG